MTADSSAEQSVFHAFMTPTKAPPAPSPGGNAGAANAGGSHGTGGGGGSHRSGGGGANAPGLDSGRERRRGPGQGARADRDPVYYPKLIQSSSQYCSNAAYCARSKPPARRSYPRAYLIHDRQGVAHYAYRMTLVINPALGQYYGVQGTTWQNPPILSSPSGTKTVSGKQLLLYSNGSKLSRGRVADPAGRVLDLEHADRRSHQPADGRDRRVADKASGK